MLCSISLVITCKISNKFLSNDIINDFTADSKDQESIQLSNTSDKGHHMEKCQNTQGNITHKSEERSTLNRLVTTIRIGSLMKVKSIAECSTWSIPQYF